MPQRPPLDRIDTNIVELLQRDGRITDQRLADAVALSPSACLSRVRRLEAAGVITGYKAQVNPAKIGPSLTIFAELTVSAHDMANTSAIETALQAMPEAIEAYQVSGNYDFLVRFLVPDMDRWTELADQFADGALKIDTVKTVAAMRQLKRWSGVPLKITARRD